MRERLIYGKVAPRVLARMRGLDAYVREPGLVEPADLTLVIAAIDASNRLSVSLRITPRPDRPAQPG